MWKAGHCPMVRSTQGGSMCCRERPARRRRPQEVVSSTPTVTCGPTQPGPDASPAPSATAVPGQGHGTASQASVKPPAQRHIVLRGWIESLPQPGVVGTWRVSGRNVNVSAADAHPATALGLVAGLSSRCSAGRGQTVRSMPPRSRPRTPSRPAAGNRGMNHSLVPQTATARAGNTGKATTRTAGN